MTLPPERRRTWAAVLAALLAGGVLLLPACGGGGGGGSATPAILASPTAIPPLRIVTPTPGGSGNATAAPAEPAPTVSGAGAPAAPAATSAPTQAAAPPGHYVVQSGDTLYGIAARFNVSLQALMQANGISDPSLIRVGQELAIPPATP